MMFLVGSTATAFLTAFGEGAMLAESVYLASRGAKRRRQGNPQMQKGQVQNLKSQYVPALGQQGNHNDYRSLYTKHVHGK